MRDCLGKMGQVANELRDDNVLRIDRVPFIAGGFGCRNSQCGFVYVGGQICMPADDFLTHLYPNQPAVLVAGNLYPICFHVFTMPEPRFPDNTFAHTALNLEVQPRGSECSLVRMRLTDSAGERVRQNCRQQLKET